MFIYKFNQISKFKREIYKTNIWVPSDDLTFIGYYLYHNKKIEYMYVLPYKNQKLQAMCEISKGSKTKLNFDCVDFDRIKDYFDPTSIIVTHNHPDNTKLYPSLQDRDMNRTCLIYCNEILGIKLKDNIIFTPNGEYISFINEEEWDYAGQIRN